MYRRFSLAIGEAERCLKADIYTLIKGKGRVTTVNDDPVRETGHNFAACSQHPVFKTLRAG